MHVVPISGKRSITHVQICMHTVMHTCYNMNMKDALLLSAASLALTLDLGMFTC